MLLLFSQAADGRVSGIHGASSQEEDGWKLEEAILLEATTGSSQRRTVALIMERLLHKT